MAVTHADPLQGNTGNTPGAGASDSEAVTHVTQLPPALGNSRIVSQGIDTARVSNSVTHVTHVTQEKEHVAKVLARLLVAGWQMCAEGEQLIVTHPTQQLTDLQRHYLHQYQEALLDLLEALEERAAIAEWCGRLPRAEVEALAWQCVLGEVSP